MRCLFLIGLAVASPACARITPTDAAVSAFIARQERAWNSGDMTAYFAGYAPDATFTDQAYVGDKPPVAYGTSTLTQARKQARVALARSKASETVQIQRIMTNPDGRTVVVIARVASSLKNATRTRRLCAVRRQTLVSLHGRVISTGRTDTYYPCPR